MRWNFATSFESIADALSDRVALRHGPSQRTWRELDDRAARLAQVFAAAGLGPDSKVAAYLYNGPEYVETFVATLKLRAVPVNVNYRYLEDELVYLLENSDAEALVYHASLADRVAAIAGRAPNVKLLIQVDDTNGETSLVLGAKAYEEVLAAASPAPRIERDGDELIFLYTGGTTGMPKGVMWRNEDLFGVLADAVYGLGGMATPETSADCGAAAVAMAEAGRSPVHIPASPLMHGTGLFTTLQSMLGGGTVVTLTGRHFDPHELWQTVQDAGVTQMAIVGDAFAKPMLAALRDAEADSRSYDVTTLGIVISSGVMWSSEVKQEMMQRVGCICFDSLGSSEGVGFANSISVPGAETTTAKFSIGAAAVVLTDDGREVVPGSGETGMLAVGGHIPLGYYKDEAKSAGTFQVVNGKRWSIPGDYATVEADGTITLLGRGSACINSGGEKIYPEEIEEAIKQHASVADCLVVGIPDERFGEVVAAVVTLEPGVAGDPTELQTALTGLSRVKHPKRWIFVEEMLRAPNGKADYKAAKARAAES